MKGRKKQVLTKNTTNVDYKKVSDFFHTQLKTHLKDVFIQKTTDGWNLFNRFKIRKANDGYYQVTSASWSDANNFGMLKNAIAWTIHIQHGRIIEASNILLLDKRLCSLEVEIPIHKEMLDVTKDMSTKLIYLNKLEEDILKKHYYIDQMKIYINTSNTWQQEAFAKKKKKSKFERR